MVDQVELGGSDVTAKRAGKRGREERLFCPLSSRRRRYRVFSAFMSIWLGESAVESDSEVAEEDLGKWMLLLLPTLGDRQSIPLPDRLGCKPPVPALPLTPIEPPNPPSGGRLCKAPTYPHSKLCRTFHHPRSCHPYPRT